jgi:predicted RND superfamily exporter protein
VLKHGNWIWFLALLVCVPATYRTVELYVHLKSDIEELLPPTAPSVVALGELRRRTRGLQYLGVMVDAGKRGNLAAAERFLDDLATRIRGYPPELVREVRVGTAVEQKYIERNAPLYVDVADLKEIRSRIEARRDYEVARETGLDIDDDEPAPSVETSDIESKYEARSSATRRTDNGRFTNADDNLTMLFVELGGFSSGVEQAKALLDKVKADVAALGGPAKYASGMRIGYASDVASAVEEMDALQTDLSVSSILVVIAVMAVIVAYFRWGRSVLILVPPLLVGTVCAFALSSAPPFGVTELNSNTAFLGSIIVGNGINFGIILLARYREERRNGVSVQEALVCAVHGARAGTVAAALAAGISYASLVTTEFRGFRQFGYIGGLGMVCSWVSAFVLMPPLIHWFDRDALLSGTHTSNATFMRRLVLLIERWPVPIIAISVVCTGLSAWKISRFDSSWLESDFNKLRRYDTWINGEGYWGRRMDRLLGHYLTPTMVMFDSKVDAEEGARRIAASVAHGPLGRYVAAVRTIDDVVPLDQDAKLEQIRAIRRTLTPRVRAAIAPAKRARLDDFLGRQDLDTITVDDVPDTFLTGLRERDGTIGRQVLVYPKPGSDLSQASTMSEFTNTLRGLAAIRPGVAGRVAGSIPLSSDIARSIRRDAPIAIGASLLGVLAVVLLTLRARRIAAYVIGSLIVGVLWQGGVTMLLGVKISFANFIAFPITLGIGVDYAVNVMARYVNDGERDIRGAVVATGGAVGLCSLTTIIGYSSLLLAKTRALYYFGLVAVLGEFSCLASAVIVLPALLLLIASWRSSPRRLADPSGK